MRKLLLLLVIVGLLIAGDAWLRASAESRVATELQRSFDAGGEADIDFGGFPFSLRLLSGSIPVARLTSSSLVRDGVRLADLKMTMQDLEFSWSKILAGEVDSVRVRDGNGSAAVDQKSLQQAVSKVDPRVKVRLTDNGLRATIGGRSGTADLTIEDADLVLSIEGTERTVVVPLPRFVSGLRYGSVRVEAGHAVIGFSLDGARFSNL